MKTKKVSAKIRKKKPETKPLTLEILADYSQNVLLPTMDEHFVTKKEFNEVKANVVGIKKDTAGLKTDANGLKVDVDGLKTDVAMLKIDSAELKENVSNLKTEFNKFKNSSLTNQDAILKKLDILLAEKKVGAYQKERETELLAIIIKSPKEHSILSSSELERISKLGVF